MTSKETALVEKKAYKRYPIKVKPAGNGYVEDVNMAARQAYIKAAQDFDKLPSIKGWVARDKDGSLHFFGTKPERYEGYDIHRWWVSGACIQCALGFRKNWYPNLKWEDEPIAVRLTLSELQ